MTKVILTMLICLILINGCTSRTIIHETDEEVEYIGGKYNLTLKSENKYIQYEKDGKTVEPDQILENSMRPGLDWLRENTPEDALIMCWWDHGNAIRAYAEREPVIDAPSKEILTKTVSKYVGKNPEELDCPECISNDIVTDVANLLVSQDTVKIRGIMEKYSANYIYIHITDKDKAPSISIAANNEYSEDSIIFREFLEGFDLVYSDNTAIIFELN